MIHVIYMAAGNSRRFGSNKLLYLYEGKPLYRHGLELLLELKQEMGEKLTVTVVTQYAEILEEAQDIFERCGMAGMQAVFCEKSRLGASYTIRAGIEAVISQDPVSGQPKEGQSMIGEKDYLMFMVADQPHLTLDSVRKLIRTAVSREQSAFSGPLAEECSRWETLSLRCGSTPGNPCMFRADLIPELMSLTGDQGGRKVLKQRACKYVDIFDKRELEDVDEMLQVTENLGEK
ncbi:nucleotidyltransferase family protein [Clostridiaceae bacterium OM08-6BH]|nr:nucleotidyltransferase family protein [Clostridiaceae bacterium OM08-6BH]